MFIDKRSLAVRLTGCVVLGILAGVSHSSAGVTSTIDISLDGQSPQVIEIEEGSTHQFAYSWEVRTTTSGERFSLPSGGGSQGTFVLPNGESGTVVLQDGVPSQTQGGGFSFGAPDDSSGFRASISGSVQTERSNIPLGSSRFSGSSNTSIRVVNVAPTFAASIVSQELPYSAIFPIEVTAFDPSPVDTIQFDWVVRADGEEATFTTDAPDRTSRVEGFLLGLDGRLEVEITARDDDGGSTRQQLVFTEFKGDYNSDGLVDAADYTVWRDSVGITGPGTVSDGNRDNLVDRADYEVWEQNFGNRFVLQTTAVAVPEPLSLVLLLAVVPFTQPLRSRRS